jgi:pimeloyl-ACP methyl ester carboxylesterase
MQTERIYAMGGVGKKLEDLVVVVPGILGSNLARIDDSGDRHEIWGTSLVTILGNLVTFGKRIQGLAIKSGADPDEPGDRVVATGLIRDFRLIPGFVGIAGYDGLISRLRNDNGLAADQVREFPYDWRLSCRVNGRLLARFLDEQIGTWRTSRGNGDLRAVLVCHSMGGLVARWCVEREHGHELVSRVITIGTPYKGAGTALEALANGVRLPRHIGPRFDGFVRSLPSVRELLPTYACVRDRDGALKRLDEVDVLPADWVAAGLGFHRDLAAAVHARAPKRIDALDAFRGGLQPTLTSASLSPAGVLTVHESSDGTADGRDDRGDGTVPRDSATPPEWSNPALAKAVAQRHASMQLAASVQTEVNVILTDAPRLMTGRVQIGMRLPSAVAAGKSFDIAVDGPPGLGLVAVIRSVDRSGDPIFKQAKTAGDRYRVHVGPLSVGLYEITVTRSSGRAAPVDEVSDTVLVYSEVDADEP